MKRLKYYRVKKTHHFQLTSFRKITLEIFFYKLHGVVKGERSNAWRRSLSPGWIFHFFLKLKKKKERSLFNNVFWLKFAIKKFLILLFFLICSLSSLVFYSGYKPGLSQFAFSYNFFKINKFNTFWAKSPNDCGIWVNIFHHVFPRYHNGKLRRYREKILKISSKFRLSRLNFLSKSFDSITRGVSS